VTTAWGTQALIDDDGDSLDIEAYGTDLIVTCQQQSRGVDSLAQARLTVDDVRGLVDLLTTWLEAASAVEP
jgi:hypothetical protein